jgi:hypothetical protein
MRTTLGLVVLVFLAGCYTGARATRDANAAWRGRSRGAIEARWGKPAAVGEARGGSVLLWSYTTKHVELPSAAASLRIAPDAVDAHAEATAGQVWTSTTEVVALVDGAGRIADVQGPSLRWGPPRDVNMRWGVVLGAHVGVGRLDSTTTPLPGFGVYIGGMLSPTLALVGAYSFASGTDDDGGAIAMAGGVAAQWWPMTRLWLRAGPALLISAEPEPADDGLDLGVTSGASFAVIRTRVFVLDLRLDLAAGADVQLGTVGVGANLN